VSGPAIDVGIDVGVGVGIDVFALAAALLLGLGFHGFVTQSHPLKRLLAVNIFGNGVFMALIVIARRLPDGPDPIPQAMVLTGIVIAVSATALGLALVRRECDDRRGQTDDGKHGDRRPGRHGRSGGDD